MNPMSINTSFRSTLTASIASLVGLVSIAIAAPSQAAIINGSFDSGNLTGWETNGSASVQNGEAFLTSTGASDSSIEGFLGLTTGALDALNGGTNATVGSAIKQAIQVNAGDTLSFDWLFKANDYAPFNDFSFFSVSSLVSKLSDVLEVADYGQKSAQSSYTFQTAGTYTIGFGVFNAIDSGLNSNLSVDNVKISSTASVPEPSSMIGILAIGAFSASSALKRKQAMNGNN
jgi:hypothetical protein